MPEEKFRYAKRLEPGWSVRIADDSWHSIIEVTHVLEPPKAAVVKFDNGMQVIIPHGTEIYCRKGEEEC